MKISSEVLALHQAAEAPLPADYQSAIQEVLRLRRALISTNIKWADAVEALELLKKELGKRPCAAACRKKPK